MLQEFRKILFLIVMILLVGSTGYTLLEDWSFLDSMYMTIITLSTTGFKEIHPLSKAGQMFTMFLIIMGLSVFLYALGKLNTVIFENNFFRHRKMENKIKKLKSHYIICGYGRIGQRIAQELSVRKKPFIVVEKNEELRDLLQQHGYHFITGDAIEDEMLLKAGIDNAVGMVAVLRSDVDNVFAVLTARQLNPNLKIIARAEEEASASKLMKAGANKVVLPYEIGGLRIAQALLRPTVLDYFDEVFSRRSLGLQIEEIRIGDQSKMIDKTLAQSQVRNELNLIIIAIYRKNKEIVYNPGSNTKLQAEDVLIVIGEADKLNQFERMVKNV